MNLSPFTPEALARIAARGHGRPCDTDFRALVPQKTIKRSVRLQHIKTGRVISAPSIAAFCRRARLKGNDRLHITPVLNGERLLHKGWALPRVLNSRLSLKDVFGNEVTRSIRELKTQFGTMTIRRLLAGFPVGKVAPAVHDYGDILKPKPYTLKEYVFRVPGKRGRPRLIRAETYKQAGRKLGIDKQSAFNLSHGYSHNVDGITFERAETVRRSAFA